MRACSKKLSLRASENGKVPQPKSTKLLSMTASDVVTKIKEIGTMFSTNTTFEAQLLSSGMNGATLSCMSDIDLKDFFEKQCSFQSYQAAVLVASIKSWQL